jgi:hypothetical protein
VSPFGAVIDVPFVIDWVAVRLARLLPRRRPQPKPVRVVGSWHCHACGSTWTATSTPGGMPFSLRCCGVAVELTTKETPR